MTPQRAHEIYLETAKRLGWPIRPEVNVPYEQLSDAGKALDIALADESEREIDALRAERDRLKEALEGDNLTAKRVYRLLEERDRLKECSLISYDELVAIRAERDRYKAALEEIMSEVGTSTLAHKIARTALGGEGGGGNG